MKVDKETIEVINHITNEWTQRAARGEVEWVCADCCAWFCDGMPNKCIYGHQLCTDIIKRDKNKIWKNDCKLVIDETLSK